MTEGNIFHHLIAYAVPLMLGNVFQLTYNAVDSIIVGRYGGKDALAAVGTSGPVSTIIVLGVSGICMGAGVMMSNFFGQNNMKKLKSEYATTLVSGTLMALLVTALGLIFSRLILRLLQVPEEILRTARARGRREILRSPLAASPGSPGRERDQSPHRS